MSYYFINLVHLGSCLCWLSIKRPFLSLLWASLDQIATPRVQVPYMRIILNWLKVQQCIHLPTTGSPLLSGTESSAMHLLILWSSLSRGTDVDL